MGGFSPLCRADARGVVIEDGCVDSLDSEPELIGGFIFFAGQKSSNCKMKTKTGIISWCRSIGNC